ncbi:LANO_0A01992g1_1 [Lachancea nothofagi CBS 11611]|uniref:Mitochondrial inner membrane protease ATP23 n=1 Tax=Lachancea nothofagi CBS 11611 TaxID=1266666 RepID=A0A1G4IN20_9SACH|nr:LANO_0A01992g1_1 [Lachancea nothofagi CBS 11611]
MIEPTPPVETIDKPQPPVSDSSVRGFQWWRRTFQYKTGLNLTKTEKEQYENDYKFILQRDQCNECYKNRDWLLQYSPTVIFMAQQIARLGSRTGSAQGSNSGEDLKFDESKIICDVCPEWRSGGFHPELGILLCQNRIRDKWHLEDTLAHEMVHYYDNTRWQVDWLNLKHHACSEIRASSLSGECRFMQEFARRGLGFKVSSGHQECVRRRATLSVMGNPNCKDQQHAEKVVDEVWDSCFSDTRPFEEIYR